MSASVYDTAQALRLAPPSDPLPVVQWLLEEQGADGAWGDAVEPLARDTPTLAALLALTRYPNHAGVGRALQSARAFLETAPKRWSDPLAEGIPVAVEVIVTSLLQQAAALGIDLEVRGFAPLVRAGLARLPKLRRIPAAPGLPPAFCFEAWGTDAVPAWLDDLGSVATNPAASAGWYQRSTERPDLEPARQRVRQYLDRASATTCEPVGVMPSAWPIERFELAFGLLPLVATGLLTEPRLSDVLAPNLDELARILGSGGIGHSYLFHADVDDTAAAMAVLSAAGRKVDWKTLELFRFADHFVTYPGESHASISATARAVFALRVGGREPGVGDDFFSRRRQPDGRFTGDKWNSSWLYTTWSVVLALPQGPAARSTLEEVAALLLAQQKADGGWGSGAVSSAGETSYALLTFHALLARGLVNDQARAATRAAYCWLRDRHRRGLQPFEKVWICKELYSVPRIDTVFALAALLSFEASS